MNKILQTSLLCLTALLAVSCDGWIDDATTPKNTLSREELNRPAMLAVVRNNKVEDGALVANLKTLAGQASARAYLALGAMVDEIGVTRVPNTLIYKELKEDIIQPNSTPSEVWNPLQNFRARAEELLDVEKALIEDGTEKLPSVRAYARYTGHFYAGYAYVLLANCFSDVPGEEGRVRINGKWLTHKEMYDAALYHYNEALTAAQSDELKTMEGVFTQDKAIRSVHALMVKLYMQRGAYAEAAQHWEKAYAKGESLQIVYNINGEENLLYATLGETARDAEVDIDLVNALRNTAEQKAVPTALNKDKNRYLTSLTRYSPLTITDDAELQLIRAELIVRGNLSGDALAAVNDVISRYDAASVETEVPTLLTLSHLRRVYLILRGERAADYRRGLVNDEKKAVWAARKNRWMPLPELELK